MAVYWWHPSELLIKPPQDVSSQDTKAQDEVTTAIATTTATTTATHLKRRRRTFVPLLPAKATNAVAHGLKRPRLLPMATSTQPPFLRERIQHKQALDKQLAHWKNLQRNIQLLIKYEQEEADEKLQALTDTWRRATQQLAMDLRDRMLKDRGLDQQQQQNDTPFASGYEGGQKHPLTLITAAAMNPFAYDPEGHDLDNQENADATDDVMQHSGDAYHEDYTATSAMAEDGATSETAVPFTLKWLLQLLHVDVHDMFSYDEENDCFLDVC